MIDEKKLDKEIAGWFKEAIDNGHHEIDTVDTSAVVRHIVDNQPKVGEWIPVSERLPEMEEYVLVSDVAGYVQVAELYRDEDGELKWEDDKEGLDLYYEVIAWMPLPPAFVEGIRE